MQQNLLLLKHCDDKNQQYKKSWLTNYKESTGTNEIQHELTDRHNFHTSKYEICLFCLGAFDWSVVLCVTV